MASYCGPVMTDACCTYWISAAYSLARSLLSSSMSCALVSLRGAAGSAAVEAGAVLEVLVRIVFLVAFLAAGFATLVSFRWVSPAGPARSAYRRFPLEYARKRPAAPHLSPADVSASSGTTSPVSFA